MTHSFVPHRRDGRSAADRPALKNDIRDILPEVERVLQESETLLVAQPHLRRPPAGRRRDLSSVRTRSRSASPGRCCARPASTTTCARPTRTPDYDQLRLRDPDRPRRRQLRSLHGAHGGDASSRAGSSTRRWTSCPTTDRSTSTIRASSCRRRTRSTRTIEAPIAHFKIVMEGVKPPPGEVYSYTEGGNGELGFYIVSRRQRHALPRALPAAVLQSQGRVSSQMLKGGHDRRHRAGLRLDQHDRRRVRPVEIATSAED